MFMSLELLTQQGPVPRRDPSSLFPSPSSRGPRLHRSRMAKSPAEVYLNLTQKFTLPWADLNRADYLFYTSAGLH